MKPRASWSGWQGLKLVLAPPLWRLLQWSVACRPREPARRQGPVVYACLHRDMIPAIMFVRAVGPVLLISQSPDGEVLRRCLSPLGFGFVCGSTGRGGTVAVRRLLAAIGRGRSVGVAVDGPRGPFGDVQEGVVQLSRLSGRPIVPLRIRAERPLVLNTWDRTVMPRPGSRVQVQEMEPLQVPRDLDENGVATWCGRVAASLLDRPTASRAREGIT
jgi:lysophospholipid acyltransferase (LPLAT)-like uncharacterized protein